MSKPLRGVLVVGQSLGPTPVINASLAGVIGRASGACVAQIDRQEALEVGEQAVAHLAAGGSGQIVALERVSDEPHLWQTGLALLAQVANAEKLLPREFVNEAGNMIIEAFWKYALPLIDGPLPRLARLRGDRIRRKVTST